MKSSVVKGGLGNQLFQLATFFMLRNNQNFKDIKLDWLEQSRDEFYININDDLEKDFGFKPTTSIFTGIDKFVDWYLKT